MKTVISGALGECVHVAGVINFLRLAESAGWRTVFLGCPLVPAQLPLDQLVEEHILTGGRRCFFAADASRLLGIFNLRTGNMSRRYLKTMGRNTL